MDEREQMQTMMIENMQRSDLTVYEQAQGFQMMMDFGQTVEQISDKSGFSQSTVRRRIKLLELNHDSFKKAEKRGATLSDFAQLDKIEDLEAETGYWRPRHAELQPGYAGCAEHAEVEPLPG